MALEQQRWTLEKVFSGIEWRWAFRPRGGALSLANFATSKDAERAAKRAWKVTGQ